MKSKGKFSKTYNRNYAIFQRPQSKPNKIIRETKIDNPPPEKNNPSPPSLLLLLLFLSITP